MSYGRFKSTKVFNYLGPITEIYYKGSFLGDLLKTLRVLTAANLRTLHLNVSVISTVTRSNASKEVSLPNVTSFSITNSDRRNGRFTDMSIWEFAYITRILDMPNARNISVNLAYTEEPDLEAWLPAAFPNSRQLCSLSHLILIFIEALPENVCRRHDGISIDTILSFFPLLKSLTVSSQNHHIDSLGDKPDQNFKKLRILRILQSFSAPDRLVKTVENMVRKGAAFKDLELRGFRAFRHENIFKLRTVAPKATIRCR